MLSHPITPQLIPIGLLELFITNKIYIIGMIRSVVKRSNDTTYYVDDMTSAPIQVKLQADENEDLEQGMGQDENLQAQTQFIENSYIKVFGIIKSLQGNKYIQAFKIVPIKELNEITVHILECINSSITHANKALNGGVSGVVQDPNESITMNKQQNPLKNANLNGTFDADRNTSGLLGLQAQVSHNEAFLSIIQLMRYFLLLKI